MLFGCCKKVLLLLLLLLDKHINDNTRITQEEALLTIHQLLNSDQVTTDQIDKAAKLVIDDIYGYHLLAQTIWPMAQSSTTETNTNLHPHVTKSDTR